MKEWISKETWEMINNRQKTKFKNEFIGTDNCNVQLAETNYCCLFSDNRYL